MDATEIQVYSKKIDEIARGGSGSGASATTTLKTTGGIRSAKVHTAGSGYAVGDVLTVAVGTGGTLSVTAVTTTGAVKSVTKLTSGTGYANATNAATTVAPAGGTGCTVDTVVQFDTDVITVDQGGSHYVSAVVKFNGGGNPSWSYGAATIDSGAVDTVTPPAGVTFTSVPTIVIEPGGPATDGAFITALRDFDDSIQTNRLIGVLKVVLNNELLTPESAPVVATALDTLENL